uniref:NADH-ubiquinone oxidoreductase chain 5 n=1 Tax=Petrobiellus sp. 1 JZ-2014 TaxID=1529458 RepID=A0A0B4N519_9INSE|nr:NADH dehydrogenase subunit 5 [Petrobiellus sp. 1 JZ-2014]
MVFLFNICYISSFFLLLSSVLLLFCGAYFICNDAVVFVEWEFFMINSSSVVMTFLFDWMSLIFLGFVMFISCMVIFYSSEYMMGDYNLNRFILLVMMFVFSMGMLIISPNLISILLGWDGLGLVSYCLVIYYQNVKSCNAGMLTAMSNRIGDVAILLCIAWVLNYGSWNYIYYVDFIYKSNDVVIISGLVILAGMTKSAQIPFSAWLPAAMAAPTPVSALVHSSTLVTAGVYLLIRFSSVLCFSGFMSGLMVISTLTMFMAGLGANYENDLKKIVALSTLSQLGVMMMILSMGYPVLAFFHLLTHAMFKALLFLSVGAIIHNSSSWQDIRSLGGMVSMMPLTSACFNIANLALCGMPFLAGFYSKDLILEMCMMTLSNILIFILLFVSTGLTVCYSFRLAYYSMSGLFNMNSCSSYSDDVDNMTWPMILLTVMSITVGACLSWFIFFSFEVITLPWSMKYLILFVCIIGGLIGYMLGEIKLSMKSGTMKVHSFVWFSGSMWFMPLISTYGTCKSLYMGYMYLKNMDQGWLEFYGGQGAKKLFVNVSNNTHSWHSLNTKVYLMTFLVWILVLVLLYV